MIKPLSHFEDAKCMEDYDLIVSYPGDTLT